MDGTNRDSIKPGRRVFIVQKQHQSTGELTEGIVADILTNSPNHPRGIKVRLESGAVGRVQVMPVNSVDISDYGNYDTSTIDKEVMITVKTIFRLE